MPSGRVEAVERALKVLDAFTDEKSVLTLTQIADITGFYKSTVLRLTSSLIHFEYLVRQEDGKFKIGPSLFRLGEIYRKNFDSSEVIRPVLRQMSREINESFAFYIKHENLRICLYRVNANRAMRHEIKEGAQLPLDKGASGRILLAYSGATDRVSEEIRQKGWYLSQGERDPDVAALSVPVLSLKGSILGALSVSGLNSRFTQDFVEKTIPHLQKNALVLGERLFCQ
jgi:DNA-binding IclR family transcriptional regulator